MFVSKVGVKENNSIKPEGNIKIIIGNKVKI